MKKARIDIVISVIIIELRIIIEDIVENISGLF